MAKSKLATVIEITDTHLKLVQAQGGDGGRVVHVDIQRIEQFTDEALEQQLGRMSSAFQVEDETLTLLIPRRMVILKQLSLPSQSEEEIRRMLGLQIVHHMPYARNDAIFDFSILTREPSGYSRILVVIAHREIVVRYLKIMQKANLNPQRVSISSFGLAGWAALQAERDKSSALLSTLLLGVDHAQTEVCFLQEGCLRFSRSIPYGAQDINDEKVDALCEQVGLTLGAYRKGAWGEAIQKIMIIVERPRLGLFRSRLEEYYKVPVEELSSWEGISLAKALGEDRLTSDSQTMVAAPLGILLCTNASSVDLMPLDLRTIKRSRAFRVVLAQFLLMAGLVVILAGAAFGVSVYREMVALRDYKQELTHTAMAAQQASERMALMQYLSQKTRERIMIADVVNDLLKLTPKDVVFSAIQLDRSGALAVRGSALTGKDVNAFQSNLVNSDRFKDVSLEYATKRRRVNAEVTEFRLVCRIHIPEGASP